MYDDDKRQRKQERARGNATRTEILSLLDSRGGQSGLPATAVLHEIPDALNLSTVAYHLRVLEDAELVKADGDAPVPVYSLA